LRVAQPAVSTPQPHEPRFTAWKISSATHDGRTFFRGASASSAISIEDAQRLAHAEAKRRAEAAAAGLDTQQIGGRYPYPERVLNEPVLERILFSAAGATAPQELGRITRNSYHASVLNAYRVMFVDVDTIADTSNAPSEKLVSEAAALSALTDLVGSRPDLSFRVYMTRGGLRYLCTSRLFDPLASESQDILQRLRSDARYATLCRVQKCYRARLTPKYWRCTLPPEKSGWISRILGARPAAGLDEKKFATCRYAETVGRAIALPEIDHIVKLHDATTESASNKPLA
jgi:hypothetical protein